MKKEGFVACRDLTEEAEAREEMEARRRVEVNNFIAAGLFLEKNIAIIEIKKW